MRLDDMSNGDVALLRRRLATAELPAFLSKLYRKGDRIDDALRNATRIWHARHAAGPAAILTRLFVLGDGVSRDDASSALGNLDSLAKAEMITGDATIIANVRLAIAGDEMCFGDARRTPNAILPLGGATVELARVASGRNAKRALDLGCGAGAIAIAMARTCERVVASDIDPRAAAFARFNARLNEVANIEVRVGDLFETVRGEQFDLIASQPPFLAHRGGARSSFAYGGARGDEIALRVVRGARDHLEADGIAIVLADWPLVEGDELAARVETEGVASVVLRSPNKDLDEHVTLHAAAEHDSLDEIAAAVIAQRGHLDACGVRAIALAWVALRPSTRAWSSELAVKHPHDAPMTFAHLARIFASHELAHASDDTILDSHLRATSPWLEQTIEGAPSMLITRPPHANPEQPAVIDSLAALLANGSSVRDAVSTRDDQTRVLAVAREALMRCALES